MCDGDSERSYHERRESEKQYLLSELRKLKGQNEIRERVEKMTPAECMKFIRSSFEEALRTEVRQRKTAIAYLKQVKEKSKTMEEGVQKRFICEVLVQNSRVTPFAIDIALHG